MSERGALVVGEEWKGEEEEGLEGEVGGVWVEGVEEGEWGGGVGILCCEMGVEGRGMWDESWLIL